MGQRTLSEIDDIQQAQEAVRDTIRGIVGSGGRPYWQNVSVGAEDQICRQSGDIITRRQAIDLVKRAIAEMKSDEKLYTPDEPWKDWVLKN